MTTFVVFGSGPTCHHHQRLNPRPNTLPERVHLGIGSSKRLQRSPCVCVMYINALDLDMMAWFVFSHWSFSNLVEPGFSRFYTCKWTDTPLSPLPVSSTSSFSWSYQHRLRIMPRLIYSNTGLYVAQDANASATVRCLVQIQSTRPMYAYLINALGDPLRSNVYSRNNLGRDFRNTQGCTCKVHWTNPTPT